MATSCCLEDEPVQRRLRRNDAPAPRALTLVRAGQAVAPAAPPRRRPRSVRCRRCDEAIVVDWAAVISSHRTSSEAVTYVRCPCGGIGLLIHGQLTA